MLTSSRRGGIALGGDISYNRPTGRRTLDTDAPTNTAGALLLCGGPTVRYGVDDFDRADITARHEQVITEAACIHHAKTCAVHDAIYYQSATSLGLPKPLAWLLLVTRAAHETLAP